MLSPIQSYITVVLLLSISGVYSTRSRTSSSCSRIIWSPCPGASQFDCGSLQVPLSYADLTAGNATLAVVRFKATNKPRLGTLFANPGGPGQSGVAFLINRGGRVLSNISNHQYDIVSWDPRGVNQSQPRITCGFNTTSALDQFFANTVPGMGIEARGNFTNQFDLDSFYSMVNSTDDTLVEAGKICVDSDGAFLKYMGTTAVANDLVSLSDCIEGPEKKVNYWGLSYGTVIGNYFVNMFPERVGRVVLDGVVDSILWATEPSFKIFGSTLASAESALAGFINECLDAGPQNCSIAQEGSTATSLSQEIMQLIDAAYDAHKAGNTSTASFEIRDFLYTMLHTPTTWDAILVPQLLAWKEMFSKSVNNTPSRAPAPQTQGTRSRELKGRQNMNMLAPVEQAPATPADVVISCVDSIDQENVTTQQVFEEIVRLTHEESPTFGEVSTAIRQLFCHRFPVRAVERFVGPFDHKLANPIIVLGNKLDPTTPLANAQKIAAILGSSARLLEQDGIGHTSLVENSDCTQKTVGAYLLHGTLPRGGKVCTTDQALFPPNRTLIFPGPALG